MTKRISIIGGGTAGVISAMRMSSLRKHDEIVLYHDPNIKPQAVGEGADLGLSINISTDLNFTYSDLFDIDGTIKYGIRKIGWRNNKDFVHHFISPTISYHFNAHKLQKFILDRLQDRVKIISKAVSHNDIDSDYIIDCSGKPKTYDEFTISKSTPVNSVYVNQCYWDYPRFNYTLAIARPYGWVFGIPLLNRCSIGYLYNKDINSLEEIEEDVKNVFEQFNLTPSETTNKFDFNNYYRKDNYEPRIAYNGNASFFLEPLEALTIGGIIRINNIANAYLDSKFSLEESNNRYKQFISMLEVIMSLHYIDNTTYNTEFWKFATENAKSALIDALDNSIISRDLIKSTVKQYHIFKKPPSNDNITSFNNDFIRPVWESQSFYENLSNLDLMDYFTDLLQNRYQEF